MKTLLQKLFVFVLLIGFIQACNEPLVEEQTPDDVELKSAQKGKVSYIVVMNDSELNDELANLKGYEMRQQAAQKTAEKVMKRAGIIDGELGLVYGTAIKGFSVKIPPGQLKKLENDPAVVSVTEDKLITLIKPGTEEVSITSTQVIPWGITRVKGGVNYSGPNVAWVIDTGIDLTHPDLNVDASRGKTFVTRTSSPNDDNGHGTHVAGTIAAINNTIGVVGVAAGATVIPVKVLDRRGSGYMSWIIGGVDFVAANGKSGDVANMSLGGSKYDALNDAVIAAATKEIKFSLAAGNENTDANNKSPASAEGDNIYTVSAMASGDLWASYSNYGNPPIDYCAPGSSIYSTYKDGGYATASGTSMAAPHVAGILLLGSVKTDGYVIGDPDGNPDPIASVNGGGTTPTNNPPSANFTFTTNESTATFTDQSSDSDGSIVSWNWNFGDKATSTAQNPSYTYAAAGTYTVTLTVTDDDGATGTVSKSVTVTTNQTSDISLTAAVRKVRGVRFVDFVWSDAVGDQVNIKMNGTVLETVTNDGDHTIDFGRLSGTFIFQVCETEGSACSNEVTLAL